MPNPDLKLMHTLFVWLWYVVETSALGGISEGEQIRRADDQQRADQESIVSFFKLG
jgi:hypothetical protein